MFQNGWWKDLIQSWDVRQTFYVFVKRQKAESRMSLILINSGELLITLREDWLRLRTESLKFSGLAKIFEGIFPFPAAAVSAEVWRTEVLQKDSLNFLSSSWCLLTLAGSWGWLSCCPGGWCLCRGRPGPGPPRWSWPWAPGEEAETVAASPWSGGRHPGNEVRPVTVFTL